MDYDDSRSTSGVSYTVLERCIEDILSTIKPLEYDQNKRLNTIDELASSILSIGTLKGAIVKPFGSFVSNLYSKWGDLDVSITLDQRFNSSASRRKKQNLLHEIMRTLRKKGIGRKIQFIPQARVPLLVYESRLYGVSCDVSVDNHQGRVKSKILQFITSLDQRFTDMVLLIKEWAKAQNINDPKAGTLNSYSLCLLVIFHLQTCEPAILPPLKEIYNGNISDDVEAVETETEREIENVCAVNVQKIISRISGNKNQSSLTYLLVSFFDKFSEINALSSEYVICTFTGRWGRMTNNPRWTEKSYSLIIEDPFEQPDNTARAVGPQGLRTIAGVFQATRQFLCSSSVLSDRNSLLHLLSRPLVSSQLGAPKSPIYTYQQSSLHQYPNMNGPQQGDGSVGYCVSVFSEPSHNPVRTTRSRTTGSVDTYLKKSTQLANGSDLSQSDHKDKPVNYCASSFQMNKEQICDSNRTRDYRNGFSDLKHLSQLAYGSNPSRGNLRKLIQYSAPSFQVTEDPIYDASLTHNHRNYQTGYAAQFSDRFSQDYVPNKSHKTGIAIVEPKCNNLAQNHRNHHVRFAEQTPERYDGHHDSDSSGVYRTGMASMEPAHEPSLNRNHESNQGVGHCTTSPDLNYDAGKNAMIHTELPTLLHGQLTLNGLSYGSRSSRAKKIWQPKAASNQGFL